MSQDKPLSSDPEQRRNDTRASRYQSGLPPEAGVAPSPDAGATGQVGSSPHPQPHDDTDDQSDDSDDTDDDSSDATTQGTRPADDGRTDG